MHAMHSHGINPWKLPDTSHLCMKSFCEFHIIVKSAACYVFSSLCPDIYCLSSYDSIPDGPIWQ